MPVPAFAKPIDGKLFVHDNTAPLTSDAKAIDGTVLPIHSTTLAKVFVTAGVGFTVIVKITGVPAHPLAEGVTVTVAVTGTLVVFVAVNAAILPAPLAAKPIEVVLFVQAYVVPDTLNVLAKFTAFVVELLQSVWLVTALTVGVGFTVIVKLSVAPWQPFAEGVTVIVPEIGVLVVFVAVNEETPVAFPALLSAKPIAEFVFTQV